MVELYCELLLARANVLDQLAFGEKGAKARSRGKDALKRVNQTGSPAGAGRKGDGEGRGGLFGGAFGRKKEDHGVNIRTDAKGGTTIEERGGGGAGAGAGVGAGGDDGDDDYIDQALDEAAVAVFYAWSRFPHDVRELTILRSLLADRWGKDFMTLAQDNKAEVPVPERLAKGLRVRAPSQELVDSYLREIAKAYGVDWPAGEKGELGDAPGEFEPRSSTSKGPDGGDEDGGDVQEKSTSTSPLPSTPQKPAQTRRTSEAEELNRFTPPRGLHSGRSPVSVAPPGPRSDNPNPKVKLPGPDSEQGQTGEQKSRDEVSPPGARKSSASGAGAIPEVDELTKRFAALRR